MCLTEHSKWTPAPTAPVDTERSDIVRLCVSYLSYAFCSWRAHGCVFWQSRRRRHSRGTSGVCWGGRHTCGRYMTWPEREGRQSERHEQRDRTKHGHNCCTDRHTPSWFHRDNLSKHICLKKFSHQYFYVVLGINQHRIITKLCSSPQHYGAFSPH